MTCKTCKAEMPDGKLGCESCLRAISGIAIRKLVLENAIQADFYGFGGTLHVFDKHGREHHSAPMDRVAWCGAAPQRRGRTALADVTFSTRTFLNKVSGVCKACLGSAGA